MMCELISEKRPGNEEKVPQEKNGEDGPNWYAYVGNDPVNFIDPTGLRDLLADDIRGNPITLPVQRQEEYLKAKTNIVIQRDSAEVFYNDTLNVRIGNQTFQQFKVQSEADIPEPDLTSKYKGRTLKAGTYKGILLKSFYSYIKPIQLVDDFYIHPDQFTTEQRRLAQKLAGLKSDPWSKPYSAGCQICKLSDFNSLTSTLEGFGFQYNNKDTINVSIVDDKKGK